MLFCGCALFSSAQEASFQGAFARWSANELTVGNQHFQRRWAIRDGQMFATSFEDRDAHKEWIAGAAKLPSPRPAGVLPTGGSLTIHAAGGAHGPVEEASLLVDVAGPAMHMRLKVFPAATGVEVRVDTPSTTGQDGTLDTARAVVGMESEATQAAAAKDKEQALDEFPLQPQHLRLTEVTFTDVTDVHNQLVSQREWMFMNNEQDILARGNVVYVEDVLSGSGLIFLKEAPLPDTRAQPSPWDVRMMAATRTVRFVGAGYPAAVLAYSGGRSGRIRALHTFERQLRTYVPGRDGALMSNTWGDRNKDSRIANAFVAKEIEAGVKLGVDAVQIDDGWQTGRTMNSAKGPGGLWSGFWTSVPTFWDVDPVRFPGGLTPLVKQAGASGVKMGLWYAPDSSNELSNWEKDAARVLELWRKDGVVYFKFDSIVAVTPLAEQRVQMLVDRVLAGSNGAITMDLDSTAGKRTGYFGAMQAGPVFVENRYTDFHRYWPHLTLRNLWQLSEFVEPVRLRMEFLNNARNTARYADDPLAPAQWSADALFATVMFSSPLGWFETSSLPPAYTAALVPVVQTWKRERDRLFRGDIQPMGEAPDGVAWTGFLASDAAAPGTTPSGGSLLVFRENNASADWTVPLTAGTGAAAKLKVLAGQGTARVVDGRVQVHIPQPLGYVWVRFDTL